MILTEREIQWTWLVDVELGLNGSEGGDRNRRNQVRGGQRKRIMGQTIGMRGMSLE